MTAHRMRTVPIALIAVLSAAVCVLVSAPVRAAPDELGALLRSGPLLLPQGTERTATATRIEYVSRTPAGAPITVSGGVYIPSAPEPPTGWPLVVVGHGTTGVLPQCAPTDTPDHFGNAPLIVDLIRRGFAVVMSNYQGLGGPGTHPYLDSTSHGLDVLGSVRAARSLPVHFTPTSVLYGLSQGGRATEAAAELAPSRTPELKFSGNAMVSPALRIDYLPAVDAGTLSTAQISLAPALVRGAQAVDPSISTQSVLHGSVLQQNRALLSCANRIPPTVNLDKATSRDVRPDPSVRTKLAAYFDRNQLPRTPNRAIAELVTYGRSDDLVRPRWTEHGIFDLCHAGVTVWSAPRAGGHFELRDLDTAGTWIADRFAGLPAPSNCPRLSLR